MSGPMQPLTPADYFEIAKLSDPEISPDGSRVAFVQKQPNSDRTYESNIYVVDINGGAPERFTLSEGFDSEPRWSPSGDRLAFVSSRGGFGSQLWVLRADGGEARRVTDVVGGVSQITWAPDGETIAFVQSSQREERKRGLDLETDADYERSAPDPRVIDRLIYRDGRGYFDGERQHVYRVDLQTDAVTRLTEGEYDYQQPTWGDADTLYYLAKRTGVPDDSIIHDVIAYSIGEGSGKTLFRTATLNPSIAATPDGRIAYVTCPRQNASLENAHIEVVHRDDLEPIRVTDGLDRTVSSAPQWGPDDEDIYFLTPDTGRVLLRKVPDDGGGQPTVVGESNHVTGFDVTTDRIVVIDGRWNHPGELHALDERDGTSQLTDVNTDLVESRHISEPKEVWFTADDGTDIQGWILRPPGFDSANTYPGIVTLHGGPHHLWTTSGPRWHEFHMFAAAGYVVFWCNTRGSTGYGEAFRRGTERDWGGIDYEDLTRGIDYFTDRDYVEDDALFITGGSYGAYLGGMTLGKTERFRAAALTRGSYDRLSFYGTSSSGFKTSIEMEFGTTPWAEPELLWERSPAAHVDEITTPTLLIHGEDDYIVPVSESEIFYRYLKKNGVKTRFVRYPGEGHTFPWTGDPVLVVDHLERIVSWFDEHL